MDSKVETSESDSESDSDSDSESDESWLPELQEANECLNFYERLVAEGDSCDLSKAEHSGSDEGGDADEERNEARGKDEEGDNDEEQDGNVGKSLGRRFLMIT